MREENKMAPEKVLIQLSQAVKEAEMALRYIQAASIAADGGEAEENFRGCVVIALKRSTSTQSYLKEVLENILEK